jgi:hypothetical protein
MHISGWEDADELEDAGASVITSVGVACGPHAASSMLTSTSRAASLDSFNIFSSSIDERLSLSSEQTDVDFFRLAPPSLMGLDRYVEANSFRAHSNASARLANNEF